jgi:hypothetical protein
MISIGIHNPTKAHDQDFTSNGKAMSSLALIDGTEQAIVYFQGDKIGAAKDMATVFDAYHDFRKDHRAERLALLSIALSACDDPCIETLYALQNEVKRLIADECCDQCGGLGGENHPELVGLICGTCLDEQAEEAQEAHLAAIDDDADRRRDLRMEAAE